MLNLLNFLSEKPGYIPIIAAILTFFSSLLGCLLAAFFTGRKDRRDAYRKLLCEHMEEIGSRTYASVALAKILLERIRNNQSRTSWLAKHKENRKILEVLRNNVRYSLYRCDEGFHKLIRLPTWIDYCYSWYYIFIYNQRNKLCWKNYRFYILLFDNFHFII